MLKKRMRHVQHGFDNTPMRPYAKKVMQIWNAIPNLHNFCASLCSRMVTFHRKAIIYKRNKTKKLHLGPSTILQKLYLPCILHLTQTRCNSLAINTFLSVRCYWIHLHATCTTYTPHILPHGTSTGGERHSIGEQKRLLLRQILLRPFGVKPAAYVQTDCKAAGWGV